MTISSISVYIYQACLCTLSLFSWQRSKNRNILHCRFDAIEVKNSKTICDFVVTGNSFTQEVKFPIDKSLIQTHGHFQNKKQDISLHALSAAKYLLISFVIHM